MAKCPFICGNLLTFASKIQIRKRMKRNIVPFLLMVATLVFASCLKSNDIELVFATGHSRFVRAVGNTVLSLRGDITVQGTQGKT